MPGRVRLLLAACGWLCAAACQAAPDFAAERASADARYAAAWVLAGADNQNLPFAVVDKRDARIYVFEAGGRLIGASAVLLGIAPGDFSVGIDRVPASLSLAERTTPAGRFEARPGRNDKGEDIVWIDYAASLALHRLRPAPVQERRPARLDSPSPDDNRISAGCVIVPVAFYEGVVAPTLGTNRSVIYVLPETHSPRGMFEALALDLF
ncbi:MAG TPA: hypothetical protein VIK58_10980 [Caldimonas sp.]